MEVLLHLEYLKFDYMFNMGYYNLLFVTYEDATN